MIWYALLSVLSGSLNSLWEKSFFEQNRRREDQGVVAYLFLFACLLQVIFMRGFFGEIDFFSLITDLKIIIPLIAMCLIAAISNGLYYYGLPKEGLSEIQPFIVVSPLVTIFLASAIFPEERNIVTLLLACIAIFALFGSHIRGKKIQLDEGLIPIALSVLVYSFEVVLTKFLLNFFPPFLMYTIRTGMIALFFFVYFRPSPSLLARQEIWRIISLPVIWIVSVVALYYSYREAGVVETILVIMLAPVMTVIGSHYLLKEKEIKKQDIVSLVIILLCVVLSQILN